MKTVIIVQARMTSTRLPGKVLIPVLGKPLLEYQLERLGRVKMAQQIVIATTKNDTDQPIVELCQRLGFGFFRGSEEDVLSRFYGASLKFRADNIVRITADCPLIDPIIIDNLIDKFLENYLEVDYVSNTLKRTYPRGMDAEVFSFEVLSKILKNAADPYDREHVTPYIYRNQEQFRIINVENPQNSSQHRWTVDTEEDFELIRRMITVLYPKIRDFTMNDCLNLLDKYPEWQKINAHIQQK